MSQQEQAFRQSVDAQVRSAMVERRYGRLELPKGNLRDLVRASYTAAKDAHDIRVVLSDLMNNRLMQEDPGAIDAMFQQLDEYKGVEEKSLSAQNELKNFFLYFLVKLLMEPAQQRLQALNAEETEETSDDATLFARDVTDDVTDDVTEIDHESAVFMTEPEAPEENAMKSLVTYCLNRGTVPPPLGRAYLETHKTLEHFCRHAFVAFWESHFAIHVSAEGFANNRSFRDPFSEEDRRSWLVHRYIRDSPKPLEIILPGPPDLPESVRNGSVLDNVRTINALKLRQSSLREIQDEPVTDDSPGVLFRIVIVLDSGQSALAGGYYDFNPAAFRDKASQNGRINVKCTGDEELHAADATHVNMRKWYVQVVTDIGHVAVPASILSRAFENFTHQNGKTYEFVDADMHSRERRVFVYASDRKYVYMSNLDLVFVDNARETNIFMNECEYEGLGDLKCNCKVAVYDKVSYCLSVDSSAKKQKRKRQANQHSEPKSRGTQDLQNLAARACNFYQTHQNS